MNHYTVCHLSRSSSISHFLFHAFIQMRRLERNYVGKWNRCELLFLARAGAEAIPGDYVKRARDHGVLIM